MNDLKAIKPGEAFEMSSDDMNVKTLMSVVNSAISTREFHYTSEHYKYFVINIFRYRWMGDGVFDAVVSLLKEAGWDARHSSAYCGHGPFYAFYLRTDDFCPEKIKYIAT